MAHKKKNPNRGPTWVGYYTRKTPTKREKLGKIEKKYKNKGE